MSPHLEPLYPLKVAAEMIPTASVEALRTYLQRRKDQYPPRYLRTRYGYARLLSLSECIAIRKDLVKPRPGLQRRAPS